MLAQATEEKSTYALPALEETLSIRTATHKRVSFEQLIDELGQADVVFLGESHTDESTHRLQLAIYEQLLKQNQNRVVLCMEMFERDVQDVLDQYLAGEIEESVFVEQSRPWNNYHEGYRPLVELAKQSSVVVKASNFPRSLMRKIAMGGEAALKDLSEEERKLIPNKFFPNTPNYWRRVDNAVRGHLGMMAPSEDDPERIYAVQSLWDNSMGDTCSRALDNNPDHLVLHLNGGFHSAYWDGTVHQLRKRKPDAKIKTVAISPSITPNSSELTGKPVADYIAYVESQATNVNRGERSVQISQDLKYLFYQPENIKAEALQPLLIWLVEDGLTAKDGMAYCKQLLGESVAIVVVEPPYKSMSEDLAVGGRWFWPDTFMEDTSRLTAGIQDIWAYLMRHYPIDPEHVCVVGEGTGATVAALLAAHSDRMKHSAIALQPRQYAKIKDMPLPLPEYFGDDPPPKKSLTVIADKQQKKWWQKELAQYADAKVTTQFSSTTDDPWQQQKFILNKIRESLGISKPPKISNEEKHYLLVQGDTPRARYWSKLQAAWLSNTAKKNTVAVEKAPEDSQAIAVKTLIAPTVASEPGILPKCPGPFGGTTVLVLLQDTSDEEIKSWLSLEENDPLTASSRFHRLRIVTGKGERTLPEVLQKLEAKNRKNVLILPSVFYADLTWLRELRSMTRSFENSMTLHWLPGLGGQPGIFD